MLKCVWDRWWAAIPAFEAREALSLYRVLFVADSGWKIDDRESHVQEWQDRARGAQVVRVASEEAASSGGRDISGEIRRLFGWLRDRWGPSSGPSDPGAAGFVG